ncbi:hypothetical protein BKD30_15330 [Tersicoccus phoenicis]|uniref:Methyltransferase domain-containing protein n=1 Tax=Tersicoccus phoenicis TaxID=554083 RepID=A0A1R1L693_9MICC|nr:hypothetical protein [Tersicoccus phoenicis]OMH22939.1 hypothetical protein BKD30_15330 [Tersicoccus phoenicis]
MQEAQALPGRDLGEDTLGLYRRVLDRVRRRQDSHNAKTIYFGSEAKHDVLSTLAERTQERATLLYIVDADATVQNDQTDVLWQDLAATGVETQAIYLVAHLGILDAEFIAQLSAQEADGIKVRVANVAWLSDDLAATAVYDCVLSDDAVLVFSPSVIDTDRSGLWTVTVADEHLSAGQQMLSDLWSIARGLDDLPTDLDLEEPLAQSARLIGDVASVLCVGDHVDVDGCTWYHGVWQYLRLMDMVSTPSWHHDFYSRELNQAVELGARSPVVSGTADYSVFAYLVGALGDSESHTKLTVVDQCNTPLFACQWYAKRVGVRVTTVSDDIRSYASSHAGQHDLIVTDAFLTRFSADERREVLRDWHTMLIPGGRVVTTIRIHTGPSRGQTPDEAVASFRDRATSRWRRWQPFVGLERQQVAAMAEYYARRMISNPIGGELDIRELIEGFFVIESSEVASVPGELYPTDYLRVVLRKEI